MANVGSAPPAREAATLALAEPAADRAQARRAVAGLLEASKGLSLGGLKIRDLINNGRS